MLIHKVKRKFWGVRYRLFKKLDQVYFEYMLGKTGYLIKPPWHEYKYIHEALLDPAIRRLTFGKIHRFDVVERVFKYFIPRCFRKYFIWPTRKLLLNLDLKVFLPICRLIFPRKVATNIALNLLNYRFTQNHYKFPLILLPFQLPLTDEEIENKREEKALQKVKARWRNYRLIEFYALEDEIISIINSLLDKKYIKENNALIQFRIMLIHQYRWFLKISGTTDESEIDKLLDERQTYRKNLLEGASR